MDETCRRTNLAALAQAIGLEGPSMLQKVLAGTRHLSPERAVDLEVASGGELVFEGLVRPSTAQAVKRLLDFRKNK